MAGLRRWPSRLLRQIWSGLVAQGTHQVAGEMRRARVPAVVLERPPAGHPERLCPEVPLSSLELTLIRAVDVRLRSRGEG
ncbi:DUF6059 family protein [Streptomyces sp. NPDC050264]|uniref:DUF6059 family protein n=1 Tax=Streptomyces sp. NPDC050264 TaxID=3155038 RepID=UPI00342B9EE2